MMRKIARVGCPFWQNSRTARNYRSWMLHGGEDGHNDGFHNGIHVFQCPDRTGITAKITECIASHGGNLINGDVFVSQEKQLFNLRSEFVYDPLQWPREAMDKDFKKLANAFQAHVCSLRVPNIDPKFKIAILVSRQDHCLIDLLYAWQQGRLPVEILCVVSNHNREPNAHILRFLERNGIPYHHLPISKENKREGEILDLVSGTDFLVLARYMQVLSSSFLKSYGKDIINIHHGLLPSFKGGNPFRQAFDAGVKLIGATSHFVTEELDGGPIIEQMVERITHRDTLVSFAHKSENLEKQCLQKAIKYYCELRVLRFGENKTIIFD
eukprot:TRINITY_DN5088_c0_g1_i1.p1 TRINITY_DN5088_c0_g1~~TRINITY_DN5088_c0_g1_i1.p1  ORF type:complete len:326 (-),score=61.23 TRINITY_DN5088_c0_g1_i1:60-1037(-)